MLTIKETADLALFIRRRSIELSYKKKASHIGGALSVSDILAVLYGRVMNVNPSSPKWDERDRLFYSKGHACMALYSCLECLEFFKDLESNYTLNGKYFTSHINHNVPGVELSTGSLGHALSVSTGVALAAKKKSKQWRSYCIVSDGELDEGSNWEAILFAPHVGLDNLTLIVDYNKIQSFGKTNDVLNLEPLSSKFEAFNWNVFEVDGHDHKELEKAFLEVPKNNRPTVVICHTIKGKGVSFMENKLEWHYKSPNDEQFLLAMKELGLP